MVPLTARKSIFIEASPEAVWKVHADINGWTGWQSSISSARAATLAIGSSFVWKSGGLTITSTVQDLEPNQRIAWTGKSLGTDAHHSWMLQAQNDGTLVTTEESMRGWLISLLKVVAPNFLDQSLDVWLRDLKKKVESAAQATSR